MYLCNLHTCLLLENFLCNCFLPETQNEKFFCWSTHKNKQWQWQYRTFICVLKCWAWRRKTSQQSTHIEKIIASTGFEPKFLDSFSYQRKYREKKMVPYVNSLTQMWNPDFARISNLFIFVEDCCCTVEWKTLCRSKSKWNTCQTCTLYNLTMHSWRWSDFWVPWRYFRCKVSIVVLRIITGAYRFNRTVLKLSVFYS